MCLRNREEAGGAGGEAGRRREVAHEVISNEGWGGEGGPIRGGLRPVWTLAFTLRELGSHWRARAEEGHELHSQFQERRPGCQVQDRLKEGKAGMLGLTSAGAHVCCDYPDKRRLATHQWMQLRDFYAQNHPVSDFRF